MQLTAQDRYYVSLPLFHANAQFLTIVRGEIHDQQLSALRKETRRLGNRGRIEIDPRKVMARDAAIVGIVDAVDAAPGALRVLAGEVLDVDGVTGIHAFSIDTGDNTDSGFYAAGSYYTVVVSAVTVVP